MVDSTIEGKVLRFEEILEIGMWTIFFSGEDNHYPNRVFLLYDGIHYDPLALAQNGDNIIQTVFSTSEPRFQVEVAELAKGLKQVAMYVIQWTW